MSSSRVAMQFERLRRFVVEITLWTNYYDTGLRLHIAIPTVPFDLICRSPAGAAKTHAELIHLPHTEQTQLGWGALRDSTSENISLSLTDP